MKFIVSLRLLANYKALLFLLSLGLSQELLAPPADSDGEALLGALVSNRKSDKQIELETNLLMDNFLRLKLQDRTLRPEVRAQFEEAQEALWKPKDYSTLVAYGLAGKHAKLVNGWVIKGLGDAMSKGLAIIAADGLSTILTKRMENALDLTVGASLDNAFKKFMDICSSIGNQLFYGGKEPFTPQEIDNWRDLTKEIFEDIEKMLKDGLKDSMRGNDFTARPVLETNDTDGVAAENKVDEDKDFLWTVLMRGYVQQFAKMVDVFEERKKHYKKTSMVVFYVDQLNQYAREIIIPLSHAKTLKDFDAALRSCKAILVAYKRNMGSLFKRLAEDEDVRPQTYSLAVKSTTTVKTARPANRRDDDDSAVFPNSYGYGGMGA